MKKFGLPATLAAVTWLLAGPAHAMWIDDYSVSASLVNLSTSPVDELGPIINVGDFNRQLVVNGIGSTGSSVAIDGGAGTATFSASSVGTMAGRIVYTPTAGTIDLSAPGTTLDLIFAGSLNGAFYDASLTVSDGSLTDSKVISNSASPAAPGPVSFLVSGFGIDLDAISEISLDVLAATGQQVYFDAPADAPVPATLPLVMSGLGMLAWLRKRRC
ncbi:MAG: PEP-CTERM sorting domain-containing protein [Thiohalocapsa sp.]|uniref:PEP-CTERM sorting domain-containing protein n=1 Tax=Thiohalocapsa sp. TaxID=2497641 RepID=UPI0025D4FC84|nr:PEP-CTERM sorting domain-containing protein [Thiohalocapsa sp.]MCG6941245.1 PEP-CTERM sorting domain-containing protein [Thiohalocapsa sp.]